MLGLFVFKNREKDLENIVRIIAQHPLGISTEEIVNILERVMPKRTLQYRLSFLVQSGILRREGHGRNSRYFIENSSPHKLVVDRAGVGKQKFTIPFSEEAIELQKYISSPIQMRHHVSYRRAFLDAYQPNKTFYLSPSILEKLGDLGAGVEKGRPAGTYARKIYQRLLIDLSWNSSRLEGNTYSLLETERLLETGEEVTGKNPIDTQMILNHKEAIEFIVDMAEEVDINCHTILNIHGLLSQNLLTDPKACGRLRIVPVKIGKSVYHPIEVPQIIEECFQVMIQKASLIKNPFEQSFFLMVQLPYLQPFADVNKRVSRLAGNIPFIRQNLSPLTFVDVPESDYIQGLLAIYERNRVELFRDVFVWAYERSASLYLATLEAIGVPDPFRVRYRDLIKSAVYEVVEGKMDKLEGSRFIAQFAQERIVDEDRSRFIEITEIELQSLHKGNFARFKIRPSTFFAWESGWK